MKVLDELSKGVQRGAHLALRDLDLPVSGTAGVLLVFWKER
jgi:hypothetical protein